jgi:homocysteine S-methyltransferase
MNLLEEMESKVVPGDGAMGTALLEAGISFESCLEETSVSRPDLVRAIHEQFLNAGARVIETNSFGANAVRLGRFGFENRVNEINWSAAQLAKQCARGKGVYVAGSVGPLGVASGQGIDRQAVFKEQIGALLDGGVDLIFLETFSDIEEIAIALYVKQSLHHCPVVCSLACTEEGALPSGLPVAEAFAKLRALEADVVGLNCVPNGPGAMLRVFESLPSDGLCAAYPNAGYPANTTPEDFAQAACGLAGLGARLLGGCCGIGPTHIAAMVKALAERN